MNILSVDFDIIMAPDIQLYNAYVGQSNIDLLGQEHPILNLARADLDIYKRLTDFIIKAVENVDVNNIRVALNHQDIEYLLKGEKGVSVYSVDHHHDCGYKGTSTVCNCANWVEYHARQGIISEFVWIRNFNSEEVAVPCSVDVKKVHFYDCNFDEMPKFDKVFLCLSPEWVPHHYHPLFFLILDLINQRKKCQLVLH